MRWKVVRTQIKFLQAVEEGHVCWERAEIIWTKIENLQLWQHAQVLQVARRNLIIGKMESVQIREAAHDELELIYRVILHVQLLELHQVHKLMHLNSIVWNVQVSQILEKLKIFFSNVVDVHTGQFWPNSLVR